MPKTAPERNPELLDQEADKLRAQLDEIEARRTEVRGQIRAAQRTVEHAYWTQRIAAYQAGEREKLHAAQGNVTAAVTAAADAIEAGDTPDTGAILTAWIGYRLQRGKTAAEHSMCQSAANRLGLTGAIPPRLSDLADERFTSFGTLFDLVLEGCEKRAGQQHTDAAMEPLEKARDEARAAAIAEKNVDVPDAEPHAHFASVHGSLTIGDQVTFQEGRYDSWGPATTERLRAASARMDEGAVVEVTAEQAGQWDAITARAQANEIPWSQAETEHLELLAQVLMA
ncbi:hypothetical protein ACFY2M_21625 [Streptomyces sp. NPDC001276]|uniref:hypothetical protein n=1 Tax=Streptomyces sp. NPDC001276 TaxID=3364555 RepID=UPI0036BCD125